MKKVNQFLALTCIALGLSLGCNTAPDTAKNKKSEEMSQPQPVSMQDNTQADAEALAALMALNRNEINAAEAAQKEKLSKPVMDYAKMMQTQHGENLDKTNKLSQTINIVPMDTKMVEELKMKGAEELTKLSALDGKAFEQEYMKSMVKGHEDALMLIDKLMRNAKNEALKSHLTETRMAVSMHLEEAKKQEVK